MKWLVIITSVAIASLRIAGLKHEAYQAAAHLWVGGLIGAWAFARWAGHSANWFRVDAAGELCGWCAVDLSIVELGCFVLCR